MNGIKNVRSLGGFLVVCAVLSAAALLVWGYRLGKEEVRAEAEGEKPIAPPASIEKSPRGEIFVVFDRAARELADIRTETLKPQGPYLLLPRSAVLRQDGEAWIYEMVQPDRFERKKVRLVEPEARGWLVPKTPAQNPVVTQGAQLLLSEEMKSGIRVGY